MKKSKKCKSKQRAESSEKNMTLSELFDYQKLADAIVKAELKTKEKEDERRKQENEKAIAEWQEIIGYKEYGDGGNKFTKTFQNLRNNFVVFIHILFFKKKNAKYDVATFAVLKLLLALIFEIFKLLLYLLAIGLPIYVIYQSINNGFVISNILILLFSLLSLIVARCIRVAQFEIENIVKREYLIGILSAITSFVAMIIALIALLIQVK